LLSTVFFDEIAQQIVGELQKADHPCQLGKRIYEGYFYDKSHPRDAIYEVTFCDKPAVLKVYSDPRFTWEPAALASYHASNKSRRLTAPKLYAHKVISAQSGWMITERLPENGRFLQSPLSGEDRKLFLELFTEYRKTYPRERHRSKTYQEELSAGNFHASRIWNWFRLATLAEENRRTNDIACVLSGDIVPWLERQVQFVQRVFKNIKMEWSFGHFTPAHAYLAPNERVYLLDFAHAGLYPRGYEEAQIVWADWLMAGNWHLPYKDWRIPIYDWTSDLVRMREFSYAHWAGALIERCLGTLLADMTASDAQFERKIAMRDHLVKLVDDLHRMHN
jgi:hypothetical protein